MRKKKKKKRKKIVMKMNIIITGKTLLARVEMSKAMCIMIQINSTPVFARPHHLNRTPTDYKCLKFIPSMQYFYHLTTPQVLHIIPKLSCHLPSEGKKSKPKNKTHNNNNNKTNNNHHHHLPVPFLTPSSPMISVVILHMKSSRRQFLTIKDGVLFTMLHFVIFLQNNANHYYSAFVPFTFFMIRLIALLSSGDSHSFNSYSLFWAPL